MDWDTAVQRIRELDAQEDTTATLTAFEMGDIALEQCPMQVGVFKQRDEALDRLADESDVAYQTLFMRRYVSARIPFLSRERNVRWSVYREIAYEENDIERRRLLAVVAENPKVTSRGIRAARNLPLKADDEQPGRDLFEAPRYLPAAPQTPAEKVELFTELAADPAVRAEAAELSSPVSRAVARLAHEGFVAREEARERITTADPVLQADDATRALRDLEAAIDRFARELRALLPRLRNISPASLDQGSHRVFLDDAVAEVMPLFQAVLDYLATGQTDIDRFLQSVLQGED